MKTINSYLIAALAVSSAWGCDDGADSQISPDATPTFDATNPDAAIPDDGDSYVFESRFESGISPISKTGQAFRQILITELKSYMGGITASVDATAPSPGEIAGALEFYLDFDSTTGGSLLLTITTNPAAMQSVFNDVSSDKNLVGKIAGNDSVTDYKDWSTAGNFVGWPVAGGESPEALIRTWIQQVDALAVARVVNPQLDPDGAIVPSVFLTSEGQDLQQLIQKLLLGAIGVSQGMDDYLDDDVKGKGLLSSNLQDGDKPYSKLGKSWDEAFGYFGASIDYDQYTDEERASKGGRDDYQGYHDQNSDNAIDLVHEYNFGNAVNCGKRDRGSDAGAKTTFGDDAFAAFRDGRALILSVDGELSASQLDKLRAFRDTVRENWEKCIAATITHYLNEIEADMDKFDSDMYDFATHAKHWSELKGFSLGLQFNPASPINMGSRFVEIQGILGTTPVLENATAMDVTQAKAGLDRIRTIMKEAYGFDDLNIAAW